MTAKDPGAPVALGAITDKNLTREILRLALPAALQHLMQTVVFLADTRMVSAFADGDSGPLAAMAVTGPVVWSLTVICTVTTIGTTALVARRVGENRGDAASRIAGASVMLALAVGTVVAAIGLPFCRSLVVSLASTGGAEPSAALIDGATGYLGWFLLLFPLRAAAMTLEAALRGAGDARTPLAGGVLANLVNLGGNWLFIFGALGLPAMGVAGAGLATAIAAVAEFVFLLFLVLRRWSPRLQLRWSDLSFQDRAGLRSVLAISSPAFVEALIFHSGFIVYQLAIYQLNESSIAAHRIAITLQSLAFLPATGFLVSASSLSGRLLGAGEPGLATRAATRNVTLGVLCMLPLSALFILAAEPLAGLFSDRQQEVAAAAQCLRLGGLETPFLLIATALTGTLRGAGETRAPAVVSALGTWLVRVPFSWLLGVTLGFGLVGVWWSTVLDWLARAALLARCVQRGRWRERQI
ncbi:MAG: MATE family efflux transporter [Planctomycetota bacterium]